jgi:hypothetical protein
VNLFLALLKQHLVKNHQREPEQDHNWLNISRLRFEEAFSRKNYGTFAKSLDPHYSLRQKNAQAYGSLASGPMGRLQAKLAVTGGLRSTTLGIKTKNENQDTEEHYVRCCW